MTLRVSLRSRYLISVRDGSTDPPTLTTRPASGLSLVDAGATHRGWLPTDGGKVVWASFETDGP